METETVHRTGKGAGIMQNVNAVDRHGHTALMQAAKSGDIEQVRDLLRRGASVAMTSEKGKTALHYAAANGHVEIVKLLIEAGADVNLRDNEWHTPLMLAAIYGCNHTVQALLQSGADPMLKTRAGATAATYAEINNHPVAHALITKATRSKEGTA